MQHARWARRFAIGAAAIAAGALSGCASNFDSQVLQPYQPSVGVHDRTGEIYAIDFFAVADDTGNGTLVGALINKAEQPDELVGVTVSDQAGEVQVDTEGEALGPETLVQLADGPSVSLTGEPVRAGGFLNVTLEFVNADSIRFEVPVVANDGHYADVEITS